MRVVVVMVVLAMVVVGMCAVGRSIQQPGESLVQQRMDVAMGLLNGGK